MARGAGRNGRTTVTVTKRELTLRIAGKLGMPPQDAARIVEALIETLAGRLLQGERWEFRGFGVFEVRERAARQGRNPRTGEVVPVPPRRAVVFHPGKFMKQEVARWDSVLLKRETGMVLPGVQESVPGIDTGSTGTMSAADGGPGTDEGLET